MGAKKKPKRKGARRGEVPVRTPEEKARQRAQENAEILESYERWHKAGGGSLAARAALLRCASNRLMMPEWLAVLVRKAIKASSEGNTDDLLGFGNKKMMAQWRKASREIRDFDIQMELAYPGDYGERTSRKRALANEFHISMKNVEKIISPTFKAKK